MKRSARRLPALILAAGMLTALAACTPPVTNLAGCAAPFAPGDNSDSVSATGAVGSEPEVDFPTPLVAKDAQVSVLEKGDGDLVYPSNTVEYAGVQLDPKTGELLGAAGFDDPLRSIAGGTDVLAGLLECVPAGSRVSVVTSLSTLYGEQWDAQVESAAQQGQELKDATQVYVLDVLDTYLGKANGWDQLPQAGMPSVVLAPNGQPGIITPNEDAPTDLRVAVLKAGTGATIEEGDSVVVQYVAVPWGEQTVSATTWEASGQSAAGPATVTVDADSPIPSAIEILAGQHVGSQILAVVPGDQPHVIVVDILKKIED